MMVSEWVIQLGMMSYDGDAKVIDWWCLMIGDEDEWYQLMIYGTLADNNDIDENMWMTES